MTESSRKQIAHNRLERRGARKARDWVRSFAPDVRTARAYGRGLAERSDPGPDAIVAAGIEWLLAAQRGSASRDGGIARHYALGRGWGRSYPETTGYIVSTLLSPFVEANHPGARAAAVKALDWLESIQTPAGGWPGSVAGASTEPVTFNTGQILIGISDGIRVLEREDREVLARGGDWLLAMQDPDGAWRRGHSRFASPGPSVYEVHTSWGLLEAAAVLECEPFRVAAVRNADWALSQQLANGWFDRCDLTDRTRPLTHTLAYAVRGLIETWRHTGHDRHFEGAELAASALARMMRPDGFLAGRFAASWEPAVQWSCLTGTSQMAICWGLLYERTGDPVLLQAMRRANSFVRRTVRLDGSEGIRGGVPGAFPISGDYGRFQLLNWAVKFTIDAQLVEMRIEGGEPSGAGPAGRVVPAAPISHG